jgi:hypothetical protein
MAGIEQGKRRMSMNIYQSIVAAMADIEPIAKGRRNKEQGFQFRGIDEIMNELQPILKKHGLFVVPEIIDVKRQERLTKSGSTLLYSVATIRYTMYAHDGSSISGSTIGEGMDSGDKASNKAMAVAMKYFLLQTFCIPTEDAKDPDEHSHEVEPMRNSREANLVKIREIVKRGILTDNQVATVREKAKFTDASAALEQAQIMVEEWEAANGQQ